MQDDLNVFSDVRPIEYQPNAKNQCTREIVPEGHHYIACALQKNIEKLCTKELPRKTGLDRNTVRRWRSDERVHSKTRLKVLKVASG
jgi:hypothetical protein